MPRRSKTVRPAAKGSRSRKPAPASAAHRRREAELRRANRALRTISLCNQALVHATSESGLLTELCRVIVEEGGYRLAWVGYAEQDAGKSVRPVASAGYEAGYLEKAGITWADEPRGRGPTGTAIRTRRPAVCRDMQNDPDFAPWRDDATRRRYASSLVLPLLDGTRAFGSLSIYAAEPDAFDAEEVKLLQELAADLVFGLQALRDQASLRQAEAALRRSEQGLREAQQVARIGAWELDLVHNTLRWSDEIYRIFEIDPKEFGASYEAFIQTIHPEDREMVNRAYTDSVRNRAPYDIVHRLRMKDGRIKHVNERCETYYDPAGRPLRSVGTVQDITERERTAEALRQAGAYNRRLIEASLDPLVTIGPDGRITDVNAATENVTGRSRPELIGTDFSDYFTEPDKARAGYRQVFREGLVRDYALELRHRDGHVTSVLYNAVVFRDEHGQVIGVFAAARDVTEHRRMEAELIASENRYRRLFETSLDGLLILNADTGTAVDANPFLLKQLGLAREEVVGRKIWDIGGLQAVVADQAAFAALRAHATVRSEDKPLVAADGRRIDVEFVSTVYPVGRHRVMKCNFRDITERKRAERALQASREKLHEEEARFRALVERSHEAVTVLDRQGRRIYASPTTERILGYTVDELLGRSAFEFVLPADRARAEAAFAELAQQTGGTRAIELRCVRHDGIMRWLEVTASNLLHIPSVQGIVINYRDVTERKEAGEALRRSEAELTEAQRIALVGSWQLDLATNQVTWSEELYRMYGLEPGRIPPDYHEHQRLFTAESWRRLSAALDHTRETGVPYQIELEMIRADGRKGWMLARGEPLRDAGGAIVGLRGTAQDVTERKEAEAALQESEAKFSVAFNLSPVALTLTTADGGIFRDVNEVFLKDTGFTRQEVIGRSIAELDVFVDPAERQRLRDTVRQLGRAYGLPCVLRMKSGRLLHCLISSCGISIAGEQCILSAILDITERKQTEEELQFRNVLLSTQQEASIDGILVVDEQARVVSFNRRFVEMWGLTAGPVAGKADEEVLQAMTHLMADPPAFLRRVQYLYAHRTETGSDELLLADGRVIERYTAPMFGPQQRYYGRVWYFRDITDRKKLEAQFLQAQKMDAFGQLAGGVAHDFNNILGVMLMQLNLLQMEPNLGGKVMSGLAELERHAMRGAGLTRQLLLFSRRQTMEPRTIDLNLLLDDISRMLRRVLGEDITFELRKSPEPLFIEADAGMVEQVVMNLCINARDAMHHGGRLVVETRRDECLPSALGPAQKVACLAVSDTGCGMDEATKARIFEPFFTTKPAGKGTGLGLATVYGIVRQHRGWVEVDSAPNRGSTFRVYFPLQERPTAAAEEAALREAPGGHESILLVEDEESLRSTMTDCLQLAGYRVVAAANGVEAIQKWEEGRREFDLLLTDYRMPEGLTGLQLAMQLIRAKDGLKVIVMSGYVPDSRETAAPWPVEVTRLTKPFEAKLLLQTVRHLLDAK